MRQNNAKRKAYKDDYCKTNLYISLNKQAGN